MSQMNLFDFTNQEKIDRLKPLAERMRPQTLDDIVGQEKIIGKGTLLYRAITTGRLSSLIFYGPPGTGKTSIASVIASLTSSPFRKLNAVTDGIGEVREIIKEAQDTLKVYGKQLILFIDEIHRFNKSQQDAFLPSVEKGELILIGATTQNPYFSLNSALLSRSLVFELSPLSEEAIENLIQKALSDERGMAKYPTRLAPDGLAHLIKMANGDIRKALNALELAILSTPKSASGYHEISLEIIEASIQKPALIYDKTGDEHYDIISAFIKSMRGSDSDATLYYMARMLASGEDPLFIARRMVIFAAEDVGLADPQALILAQNALQALKEIGMPEGRIILSEVGIYLALAPKSNASYLAIEKALGAIKEGKIAPVPDHLKDSHYKGAKNLGRGIGYLYPHDYEGHWVKQNYLPECYKDLMFYHPDENAIYQKRRKDDE